MEQVEYARLYAYAAHAAIGQKRKDTGEPYIVHPARVVQILRDIEAPDHALAAAWLHDVVEDTKVTLQDLRTFFTEEVVELVYWLTDISQTKDGNREARKRIDRMHTRDATPLAKTIKLADLIDNTQDITQYDPHFAVTYMREKQLLLEVLTEGDPRLFKQAQQQIMDYYLGKKVANG